MWGLLVDDEFNPGLPPAEPFPLTVHSGDLRVDVQSALAMLAPAWGFGQLLDISDEQARDNLARASVMAMSFVAQSRPRHRQAAGAAAPRSTRRTPIAERFMIRWRGEPDPEHVQGGRRLLDLGRRARHERLDLHRAGRSPRPAPTSPPRCPARSARCPARCTAARPSRVLKMLEEVERDSATPTRYVKGVLDRGERLMGFGHRVYRAEDPRARVLRRTARELGAPRFEVAEALEQAALAELRERRPDRVLATNVEFWAAVVLDFARGARPSCSPRCSPARALAGWRAHILEQKREAELIRPTAKYVGHRPAQALGSL